MASSEPSSKSAVVDDGDGDGDEDGGVGNAGDDGSFAVSEQCVWV